MATYKQFTATARHRIYYCYTCDHCGKDSGVKTYDFTGTASINKAVFTKELNPQESAKLNAQAQEELQKKVSAVRTAVNSKQYYDPQIFDSTCPYCQKSQSWDGKSMGLAARGCLLYALCAVGAGFLAYVLILEDAFEGQLPMLPFLAGVGICTFAGTMISKGKTVRKSQSDKAGLSRLTAPQINWNDQ